VSVLATSVQHAQIDDFMRDIQTRSLYQVLIEATVVEVSLSDQYQSGVDWNLLGRDSGTLDFVQELTAPALAIPPTTTLTIDRSDSPDAISATISLLAQFGELRVLSSPKIMTLNNQAAMLRVVDNSVYFTIDVTPGALLSTVTTPGTQPIYSTPPVYTSTVHTVPVGFVMTVTPQVADDDQVTLNVRPTISRIVRYVPDPAPVLANSDVPNAIPEIQVREMESVLKVFSGQVAILGGLMQDSLRNDVDGLPVLSRLPGVRNLFSARDEVASKTELIVFIRPVVVKQPSLDGDLREFRDYLPENGRQQRSAVLEGVLPPGSR
jgi:MSHA biogenesis protein MshL